MNTIAEVDDLSEESDDGITGVSGTTLRYRNWCGINRLLEYQDDHQNRTEGMSELDTLTEHFKKIDAMTPDERKQNIRRLRGLPEPKKKPWYGSKKR